MEISVNERIKLLRDKLGLSQRDFAEKIGMSSPGIWKLENSETVPRKSTLTTISKTFGVDRDWLEIGKGSLVVDASLISIDNQDASEAATAWKSKAEHLEKEVTFYRELLLNITGKVNFHNTFDLIGFLPKKVGESVSVAA